MNIRQKYQGSIKQNWNAGRLKMLSFSGAMENKATLYVIKDRGIRK